MYAQMKVNYIKERCVNYHISNTGDRPPLPADPGEAGMAGVRREPLHTT
jgi:hypothetical protein